MIDDRSALDINHCSYHATSMELQRARCAIRQTLFIFLSIYLSIYHICLLGYLYIFFFFSFIHPFNHLSTQICFSPTKVYLFRQQKKNQTEGDKQIITTIAIEILLYLNVLLPHANTSKGLAIRLPASRTKVKMWASFSVFRRCFGGSNKRNGNATMAAEQTVILCVCLCDFVFLCRFLLEVRGAESRAVMKVEGSGRAMSERSNASNSNSSADDQSDHGNSVVYKWEKTGEKNVNETHYSRIDALFCLVLVRRELWRKRRLFSISTGKPWRKWHLFAAFFCWGHDVVMGALCSMLDRKNGVKMLEWTTYSIWKA